MTCTLYVDGETYTRYHKYLNPIIGSRQIYNRVDGKWRKWCSSKEPSYHAPCELNISNRGATMKTLSQTTARDNFPEDALQKGDPILEHRKYILDFEFITRREEIYHTHMDGRSFADGDTLENPRIYKWNCKLN